MSKPKRPTESISDQLRGVIRDSGLSLYELARESAVNRAQLTRFVAGERSITLETLDRIAPALRIRLVKR